MGVAAQLGWDEEERADYPRSVDALPQVAAGTLIGGDFRIQRALSSGGMGSVYVAEQLSTGKLRALKLMHPQLVTDPKSRLRFIDEARVGARIPSEHVVEVVGAGVDDATGVPWLAMELLEGEDLASIVARSGALPPSSLRELMLQLGHALGAAHAQGIVHRDLKPENVFVARSRRRGAELMVKVLDFGIAKSLESSKTAATATAAMGSPLFMAPEQATPGAAIRPQTDVWALGLIAFHAITGRHYWQSAEIEPFSLTALLAEVLVHPMPPPNERARQLGATLPPGFDAWFARCVSRDPAGRFADASACVAAFDAMLQGNLHPSSAGAFALAGTMPLGGVSPAPVAPTVHMHAATPMPHAPAAHVTYAKPAGGGGGLGALLAVAAGAVVLLIVGAGAAVWAGSQPAPSEPVAARPALVAPPALPAPPPPSVAPAPVVAPIPAQPPVAEQPVDEPPRAEAPVAAPIDDGVPDGTAVASGRLVVNTTPSSRITIGDRSVGNTPVMIQLPAGPHRIRAEPSEGPAEEWVVQIVAGETTRVTRRLAGGATGGGSAPPRASESLPQYPSRGDIAAAMSSVTPAVRACGAGHQGTLATRVTFVGATGRVSGASTSGDGLPPAVTTCAMRAVRGARVPPFREDSFSVNYPFRLH